MADIYPFQGIRYNQAVTADLAQVICPPYDIISPQLQSALYWRSEHNFIRIEHARELPHDTASENKYTRSAATLTQWLAQGILTVETAPAVYLHDHYFQYQGREYRRRGIVALVRLEEWDSRVIRPHEGTLANARSDRLTLLRTLKANTSSILALFEDPGGHIASALAAGEKDEPIISFNADDGERHALWAISEGEMVAPIRQHLAHQPLYIADGHHRYETALAYQHLRRASHNPDIETPADFCLAACMSAADPGMVIRACHRVVSWADGPAPAEILEAAAAWFDIERLGGASINDVLAAMRRRTSLGCCLLYTSPSPRDLSTSRMPSSA